MGDRRRPPFWRAAVSAIVLLAVAGCTAPGQSDTDESSADVLTDAELRSALIDPQDVGHDFAVDTTRLPFYASCLSDLWRLPDVNSPRSRASRQLSPRPDGWPVVSQALADYPTIRAARTVITQFSAELDGCDHVRFRNGVELADASVRTNHDRAYGSVDRQLNVIVVGSTTYDGDPHRYDIGTWFSLVQIDNHVLVTGYTDVATEEYGNTLPLTRALIERLLAVADGRKPPTIQQLDIEPTRFQDEPDRV
jgi:hypothetical protein